MLCRSEDVDDEDEDEDADEGSSGSIPSYRSNGSSPSQALGPLQ